MIGFAHLGGPIACLGLALLLVAKTRRDRMAGLAFGAVGACVLGAAIAPHRPLELLGGVCAAVAIGIALALLFRFRPWLLPVLALACVPIRIGVHVGGASSKLLVPLYVVILGAVVLLALDLLEGDERVRELGPVAWPLAAFVGWTGLSLAWSRDLQAGAVEILAFYVPFTLLALTLARLPWSRVGLCVLYAQIAAMGVAFSIVGFYQYDTRDIFENPKLITANSYAKFFRVNSVFWDPSIYGRFLVIAMVPSIALLVAGHARRLAWAAVAAVVVTWAGLLISFSQSSFAALLVVVAAAAFLFWRLRALLVIVAAAAVLAGLAAAQPQVRRSLQHHTVHGLNDATSGRASLVANGIRIAEHHPAIGVGVGGFKRAYADRLGFKGKDPKKAASHTTPVTVAAESGLPGLALFVWLVATLLVQGFRGRRRATALVSGLGIGAIFVHSLFYNAFFEDPLTWGLMGLLVLAPAVVRPRATVPVARVEREEAVVA